MARSRRRVVKDQGPTDSAPDAADSAPAAAPAPEPEPEPPKQTKQSKPKRSARRDLSGSYVTIANVRFTDREVPPGTELNLDDAMARRLTSIGAVKPMED